MSSNINQLFAARRLATQHEVDIFENTLAQLSKSKKLENLPKLFGVFFDDTEHPEVMFGLVHYIERFPIEDWLPCFISELPSMVPHGLGWADTIMARLVNTVVIHDTLVKLLQRAPENSTKVAQKLLEDLAELKPKQVGLNAGSIISKIDQIGAHPTKDT